MSKRLDYNQIAPEGLEALGGVHGYIAQSSLPATLVDLVVCPACSIAWGWKSLIQPDGGEGLAKHKGVIARWRLKAVRSKTAT